MNRTPRKEKVSSLSALMVFPIVTAAAFVLYRNCYLTYRCNIFERAAERTMLVAEELSEPLRRSMIARRNLEAASKWIARCPRDLDLYMIAGGSCLQLGRSADAIHMYQVALTIDRRPEIYLNLGLAQLDANRPEDAVRNLAAAVVFNPNLISEVPASHQEKVRVFLTSHLRELRE